MSDLTNLEIAWFDLGLSRGKQVERERIIKLLRDTFGTLGIQLQAGSYVFATDLETLIKGEQK